MAQEPNQSSSSLLARRREKALSQQGFDTNPTLSLDTSNNIQDSFRLSENSYIRADFKIDAKGLTHISETPLINNDQGEVDMKSNDAPPSDKSFIKNFDEIAMLNVLGQGQSGYVSQAVHIPTKTVMAVKQISIYDRSKRHQIMNELNALYKTNNVVYTGLVDFYDVFYLKGAVYIALEYCECGSLADITKKLKTHRIPEFALQIITRNVLDGLIHLHSGKSKVHRDLKPANICMNKNGEAKLADFGISRDLKDSLAQCRTVVGTVTYMSPERIRAEEYDFKSDIWSLGITIFECASGSFPYEIKKVYLDLIHDIASKPAPRITNEMMNNFKLSKNFANFIQLCLEKDPCKRASASQLRKHVWITDIDKQSASDIKSQMKKWIAENDLIIDFPNIDHIIPKQ